MLHREHHLVLIVFTISLVVNTSGQGIRLGQVPTSSVGERVVRSRQVKGPVGLAMVQGLGHSKVCEVLAVI